MTNKNTAAAAAAAAAAAQKTLSIHSSVNFILSFHFVNIVGFVFPAAC